MALIQFTEKELFLVAESLGAYGFDYLETRKEVTKERKSPAEVIQNDFATKRQNEVQTLLNKVITEGLGIKPPTKN